MMKIRIIYLITIICGMTGTAFSQDLQIPGSYHWKNRILLLFSSDKNDRYQQQSDIFNDNQSGLTERDIVIFYIKNNEVKGPDEKRYGEKEAEQVRNQFQVADQAFSVVLIGKDGTQKLQQNEVLPIDKLFAVIDAMPMRRREAREVKDGEN